MRTKTLLLTAALSAAGLLSASAQTAVYSVNIVGYINKTVGSGLSLIANQLNATPDNSVQTLFGTPPPGVTVYKFTGSAFTSATYDADAVQWIGDLPMSLAPGEAAFVDNASGSPLPLTFVGEVGLNSSLAIKNGLGLYSSVIPQAGSLDQLGFPNPPGQIKVYKFANGNFQDFAYDPDSGGWIGTASPTTGPSVSVAEGFFIDNATTVQFNWARNFSVGP